MLSAFQKERDAFWRARQDSVRFGSLPCEAALLHTTTMWNFSTLTLHVGGAALTGPSQ